MPAGYSNTPLIRKLGIKPGFNLVILGAPADYAETLGALPADCIVRKRLGKNMDFVHFFAKQLKKLEGRFPQLRDALSPSGILWISWPKGASCIATDLSRDVIREIGLSGGLVDVKICAVDETWSGLKFVYRLKDR